MEFFIIILIVSSLVYLFASAKSRRDSAVETRVKRMISSGVHSSTFSDLYYEAAKSYAVAKGATAADHESASAKVVINGQVYFVVFIRDYDGGTMITADLLSNVEKSILSNMSRKQ